uniref:Uncharacterized protein n=1 Tax=Anguilla anguilla TaxID=7936 RepID=A0A0E9VEK7_ANGAN
MNAMIQIKQMQYPFLK